MHRIHWRKLITSLILCQAAGFVGSIFTMPVIPTWYATLVKPSFNPPGWVFGPVWTLLYILMGIALYLVWIKVQTGTKTRKKALNLFGIQLILNSLWSILFFGLQSPFLALLEIGVLWVVILFTTILFFRESKVAGWLMIPYLLWVSFASVLNFSIWFLNAYGPILYK